MHDGHHHAIMMSGLLFVGCWCQQLVESISSCAIHMMQQLVISNLH